MEKTKMNFKDTRDCYSHWLDTSHLYGYKALVVSIIVCLVTWFFVWVGYKNYVL